MLFRSTARSVLDEDLLSRVYGVETRVGMDEAGTPWVQVRGAKR